MRCPVNFVAVTQEKTKLHNGLDMGFYSKSHHNQPIMSADDGEVIYNEKQVKGGYVIKIKHSNNIVTTYGHLLKNSQTVKVGMKVKMGEMIARMGKSGIVTGEHLHFSIQKNGKYLDPLKYINIYKGQHVNEKSKKLFKYTKTAYNIPSEPLNIRYQNKHGKVVGHIYNGDEVESYYINDEGWNCCDNLRDYVCSNRYLK